MYYIINEFDYVFWFFICNSYIIYINEIVLNRYIIMIEFLIYNLSINNSNLINCKGENFILYVYIIYKYVF